MNAMPHQLAELLVQGVAQRSSNGSDDLTFHLGYVEAWDELTGSNNIRVNGAQMTNLKAVMSAAFSPIQVGDTVALLRFQTTYFILGPVRAPGASLGQRLASNRVAQLVTNFGSPSWTDLPGSYGPELTVYIGSSRRALVLHSMEYQISGVIDMANRGAQHQGVQITGASNIPAETAITNAYVRGTPGISGGSVVASTLVTAANGLNQGQNVFTCKYRSETLSGSPVFNWNNRVLTVIPF